MRVKAREREKESVALSKDCKATLANLIDLDAVQQPKSLPEAACAECHT